MRILLGLTFLFYLFMTTFVVTDIIDIFYPFCGVTFWQNMTIMFPIILPLVVILEADRQLAEAKRALKFK